MDVTSYLLGKNASGGGGSDLDWTAIGFNGTPQAIKDGYNHAVEIMNNWDSTRTSLGTTFQEDRNLVIMPLIDISNITSMNSAFYGCYALTAIALLNTENVISMNECFRECRGLTSVPKFNTKKVKSMQKMFMSCYDLASVPLFDTSGITGSASFTGMFTNCYNLTDTSLDNILQMCINATGYTGAKNLYTLDINQGKYPASKIQALPHYQDFIDAGWTIS